MVVGRKRSGVMGGERDRMLGGGRTRGWGGGGKWSFLGFPATLGSGDVVVRTYFLKTNPFINIPGAQTLLNE